MASSEPWKFYDLGHGYCTYDFFEQCPHRMACAKCDFYMPKDSTAALLLEGKEHLLRLLQEIPLGERNGPESGSSPVAKPGRRRTGAAPLAKSSKKTRTP